jgi:hypothetical protein
LHAETRFCLAAYGKECDTSGEFSLKSSYCAYKAVVWKIQNRPQIIIDLRAVYHWILKALDNGAVHFGLGRRDEENVPCPSADARTSPFVDLRAIPKLVAELVNPARFAVIKINCLNIEGQEWV